MSSFWSLPTSVDQRWQDPGVLLKDSVCSRIDKFVASVVLPAVVAGLWVEVSWWKRTQVGVSVERVEHPIRDIIENGPAWSSG